MLKKIDRFGFIEVDGQAFYLHWSLAGEWAEVMARKGVNYAGTIVGEFKLINPHPLLVSPIQKSRNRERRRSYFFDRFSLPKLPKTIA